MERVDLDESVANGEGKLLKVGPLTISFFFTEVRSSETLVKGSTTVLYFDSENLH